uniref:L7Ae/L30e/S12e/Gadd45 family ribosomal protein n=1 Tax=Eshraghiella crossota TaxID=45851 RepID=UPI004024C62D
NVESGEFSTETAEKENKAKLDIESDDASNNTKKLFSNKCFFYKIPVIMYSDKVSLGHSIGQELRTSVGIIDEDFAKAIISKYEKIDNK